MAIPLKEQIKSVAKLFSEPATLKALLSQWHSGYLLEVGWFNSFKTKTPIDKFGNPIPWLSYPCIDFLSERLNTNINLFEFGSGNSTFYYSRKVGKVVSVEHEKSWYNKINSNLPSNVELIFSEFEPNGDYCKTNTKTKIKFDIIIVDGVDRNNCMMNSLEALSFQGIIILDDSERKEYSKGISFIIKHEFRRIDFWGIAPGVLFKKCTTIFYKNNNCIGI